MLSADVISIHLQAAGGSGHADEPHVRAGEAHNCFPAVPAVWYSAVKRCKIGITMKGIACYTLLPLPTYTASVWVIYCTYELE